MLRPSQLLLLALIAAIFCCVPTAHARGIGTYTMLIGPDGKIIRDLGDTYSDILDIPLDLRYRFTTDDNGQSTVTAVSLADPNKTLWSAKVQFQTRYLIAACIPLPDRLVLLGTDNITAIRKDTGAQIYRTSATNFLYFLYPGFQIDNTPAGSLFLVDALDQARAEDKQNRSEIERINEEPAHIATFARFDLNTGKLLWKCSAIRPDGRKIVIRSIDGRGILNAGRPDVLYFDPATGKVLPTQPAIAPVSSERIQDTQYLYTWTSGGAPAPPALIQRSTNTQFTIAPDNSLRAADIATTKTLWTATVPPGAQLPFPITNNHLLIQIPQPPGTLRVLAADTGTLLCELPAAQAIPFENTRAIILVSPTQTTAFNPTTGKQLWKIDLPAIPAHAILTENALLLPNANFPPDVTAVDPLTGKTLWTFSFPDANHFADHADIYIQPCKPGFLIHLHWITYE